MIIHNPSTSHYSLTLVIVLVCTVLTPLISQAQEEPERIIRYSKFEKSFINNTTYDDPYRDVILEVTYTDPTGKQIDAWGFYDGGNTWRIRFRPGFPGYWKYVARFSDGSGSFEGTFRCLWRYAPYDPIKVNPVNSIWFARGVNPFFMRALHVGDRFFAENWPDVERNLFLRWFQNQGYNTLSIASHFLNRDEVGRGRGWDTPDLWPLNAEEFRKMERILDDLEQRGIIVYPFAGFFGKHGGYPDDPKDQEFYVRYTMARIGHYGNMLYNVAGPEPDMRRYIYFVEEEVAELGAMIRKYDIYNHPITVHNRTGDDPHKDSEWSTFGTLQGPKTIDRTRLSEGLLENLHPSKPLFAQETLWSNNSVHIRAIGHDYSDDDIRKNTYVITMSGASLGFADNNGNSSSGFSGSMDLTERVQRRHDIVKMAWDALEMFPWYEMKPRQDLVDIGFCLASPGQYYLVYLERTETVNVSIEGGVFGVEWINAQKPHQRFYAGTTEDGQNLTPPEGGDDWLLYLNPEPVGLAEQIHISWTDDPASSIAITWNTHFGNNPSIVEYREMGTEVFSEKEGISYPSPGSDYIHRVSIDTLKADTSYEYRVSNDYGMKPAFSDIRSFRTAPGEKEASFDFAFVSDTGLHGRIDGNSTGTLQIMKEVKALEPLFVIGGGDYAYANRDGRFANTGEAVDAWFNLYEPLISEIPFMTQYGNHEIYLDEELSDWAPRFAHPEGDALGKMYSFDIGNVHFTGFFLVNIEPTDDELEWLDNDLREARERGQEWLIVYHHEPIYGFGRSHPSKISISERIIPILEKHKVDLNLSAHDQNYERTYPILGHPSNPEVMSDHKNRYRAGEGVIYCKISPSGKKSETGNQFSRFVVPQQEFIALRNDEDHHYGYFEVKPDELKVTIYAVGDGDGKPGRILETFSIVR